MDEIFATKTLQEHPHERTRACTHARTHADTHAHALTHMRVRTPSDPQALVFAPNVRVTARSAAKCRAVASARDASMHSWDLFGLFAFAVGVGSDL